MLKKIILGLVGVIILAMGTLFVLNGKDHYDPSRYSLSVTKGLQPGSHITFTLPDQFDTPHTLGPETKQLIFVFSKATGHTVKEYLKRQPADYLKKRHTLFVADISPMPTVIRNTFALPDFKKSPFSVLLIYDKNFAKALKDEKGAEKITVITLENNTIKTVKYIASEEELKSFLD
jgi:hypothetical protein